ncbi:hypothetical protein EOA32_29240 [Mesorhizobium sp. M1A.F.Ca.ET.072.01.1.1]|uniref:hypothetical protein n=1 Tax=Mesorhizobium sp. M1A.F.Ca.ET.072.01.1.1 TaxID=2496753 RepID=UPI000FD57545|nr:hypothetical protein [Mesorhizobium sp. M1A.F.Ca.ET.072.01.1.1]RUW47291.1 hypothetical protein EOA32_29240 [Mesorhizobium sp. M1A.F.Ca.ET.072.01.1.1]TIV04340.1 MAG: hypothetical protein E5W04_03935 [Mesorhizobium sp.]
MANKYIAEVEAEEFGTGYTIRLDTDGMARLETEYGAFDFAHKIQFGLVVLSVTFIRSFLAVSLRDAKGDVVKTYDMPLPLDNVGKKCLDAFSLFRYGKDHETWSAEAAKADKKADAENPTKGTKA